MGADNRHRPCSPAGLGWRRPDLLHLELGFDGETGEAVHVSALLANNSPRSGSFTLAPGDDMSDGFLDILALRERAHPLTTARLV